MNINFNPRSRPPKGPVGQLLALIGAVLALAAAFMFSLVFFAVLAIAGLILWGYLWWKTRALRRQMREHLDARMRAQPSADGAAAPGAAGSAAGEVIEGEAVRVVDEGRRLGD